MKPFTLFAVAAALLCGTLVSHGATGRRMGELPSTNYVAPTNLFLTTGGANGSNSWQVPADSLAAALGNNGAPTNRSGKAFSTNAFYAGTSGGDPSLYGFNTSGGRYYQMVLMGSTMMFAGTNDLLLWLRGNAIFADAPYLDFYQARTLSSEWLIPTNSALSNIVVDYSTTNTITLFITNNITLTNRNGLTAGRAGKKRLIVLPQLITRGINHGLGIGYGSRVMTNANNIVSNTIPAGAYAVIDDDFEGTNIIRTLTVWF